MIKTKKDKFNLIFFILFLITVVLVCFYIRYSWFQGVEEETDQAILISEIAATGIDGEALSKLEAIPEDVYKPAFQSVKHRLESYLELDADLRFVYLYTQKNNNLYFIADSEPIGSEDYSPPGQEYVEADPAYKQPFLDKKTIITEPVTDRWGTWVSVLSPLFDSETGEVFAVLGMDYPVNIWSDAQMLALRFSVTQSLVVIFLLSIIFFVFKRVIKSEESFHSLVDNIPGVAYRCRVDTDWTMIFISNQIEEMTGYPASDFLNNKVRTFTSIIHPKDRKMVENEIIKTLGAKSDSYNLEYRLVKSDKHIIWVKEKGTAIYDKKGKVLYLDGVIIDISKDKNILLEIKIKQEELEKINKFMVGRELKMVELKEQIKNLKKDK